MLVYRAKINWRWGDGWAWGEGKPSPPQLPKNVVPPKIPLPIYLLSEPTRSAAITTEQLYCLLLEAILFSVTCICYPV